MIGVHTAHGHFPPRLQMPHVFDLHDQLFNIVHMCQQFDVLFAIGIQLLSCLLKQIL